MTSRSWLLRAAVLCVVMLLLVSTGAVEARKKQSGGGKKADVASGSAAPAAAASSGGYTATAAAATEEVSAATAARDAAKLKAEARKVELAKKKAEKRAAVRATNLKAAKIRNAQLKQRRTQKVVRDQKARAAAKQRADELLAKKRAADTPDIRKRGHEKLRWLLRETAKSGTRMINFDVAAYNTYVNEGPRPYHLMLVYTALTSQHSCMYCHMANDALIPAAQAHYERSKDMTAAVLAANSTADIPESELPVFYANIDMARNSVLFKELGFTSAPYMILAPPRLGTATLKTPDFLKGLAPRYRFNLQASMTSNDFNSFVNKLAGIHVQLDAAKPGLTDLLTTLIVLCLLGFVGIKYGYDILLRVRTLHGIKFAGLLCGLALYCWCISGGMYNIIRGTQFADVHKDGSVSYINGDARDQYAAEGLLIGVLNLACAAAVIFMNTRSWDEPAAAAAGKGAKLSPMQHLKLAIMPYLSPGVCLALFILFWSRVLGIYTMKNGGYRLGFVWR